MIHNISFLLLITLDICYFHTIPDMHVLSTTRITLKMGNLFACTFNITKFFVEKGFMIKITTTKKKQKNSKNKNIKKQTNKE